MGHQQSYSYKKLMEHYDDVLTRRKWCRGCICDLSRKKTVISWLEKCLISYRTTFTDDCLTYPLVLPFLQPESIAE